MQNQIYRLFIALILAAGLTTLTSAKEDEKTEPTLTVKDLPAAVRATVEKLTTGGQVTKIDKEDENGKVVYDIEATVKGKDMEFDIAADGKVLTSEESVDYASLPAAVRATAEKFFGSAKDLKAAKELEDGKTSFEVEGKKGDETTALKIDASGKQLEEKKD
jgi:uncharacterized membrane protein YkoI